MSLQNKIYLQRLLQSLDEQVGDVVGPTKPETSPYPRYTPWLEDPNEGGHPCPDCPPCNEGDAGYPNCTHTDEDGKTWCWDSFGGTWYACNPDYTPRPEFHPSIDLYNFIWWLIHLKYPWIDDNLFGKGLLGMKGYHFPDEPNCEGLSPEQCAAAWDAYYQELFQLLLDMLGDALQDYWDEYQEWLEDNQGGTFWDWLQEQDWWPDWA